MDRVYLGIPRAKHENEYVFPFFPFFVCMSISLELIVGLPLQSVWYVPFKSNAWVAYSQYQSSDWFATFEIFSNTKLCECLFKVGFRHSKLYAFSRSRWLNCQRMNWWHNLLDFVYAPLVTNINIIAFLKLVVDLTKLKCT